MMDNATRPDRLFDAVLIHGFSRFFRDSFKFEMHRRTLEKNNVALVSFGTQTVSEKADELRKKLKAVELRIERLYDALADGTVNDTTMFGRSLAAIENEREDLIRNIGSLEAHKEVPRRLLTKDNIARFADAARGRLRGDDPALRKGDIRQLVERIEVDDEEIRYIGPNAGLAQAMLGSGHVAMPGLPSFVTGLVGPAGLRTCDNTVMSGAF